MRGRGRETTAVLAPDVQLAAAALAAGPDSGAARAAVMALDRCGVRTGTNSPLYGSIGHRQRHDRRAVGGGNRGSG